MKPWTLAALGLLVLEATACATRTVYVVDDRRDSPPVAQAAPAAPPVQPSYAPPEAQSEGIAEIEQFYEPLSPYGRWVAYAGYGTVWVPDRGIVGASFRPYTHGHWEYTEWGWTWADAHPFGWATGHYGRWFYDSRLGWAWVPGNVWGPAWVTWRHGGGYVGWAALPPGAAYGSSYSVYDTSWVFISSSHMGHGAVSSVIIVGPGYSTCLSRTVVYRETYVVHERTVYRGPDPRDIDRDGGRVVHRPIREVDREHAVMRPPEGTSVPRPRDRDRDGHDGRAGSGSDGHDRDDRGNSGNDRDNGNDRGNSGNDRDNGNDRGNSGNDRDNGNDRGNSGNDRDNGNGTDRGNGGADRGTGGGSERGTGGGLDRDDRNGGRDNGKGGGRDDGKGGTTDGRPTTPESPTTPPRPPESPVEDPRGTRPSPDDIKDHVQDGYDNVGKDPRDPRPSPDDVKDHVQDAYDSNGKASGFETPRRPEEDNPMRHGNQPDPQKLNQAANERAPQSPARPATSSMDPLAGRETPRATVPAPARPSSIEPARPAAPAPRPSYSPPTPAPRPSYSPPTPAPRPTPAPSTSKPRPAPAPVVSAPPPSAAKPGEAPVDPKKKKKDDKKKKKNDDKK